MILPWTMLSSEASTPAVPLSWMPLPAFPEITLPVMTIPSTFASTSIPVPFPSATRPDAFTPM
jgi:hypothetical protein